MKELKANISISRPTCSNREEFIEIQIDDELSGCRAVNVRVGYAAFTQALTGLGRVPCEMSFNDSENIGKRCENKTVAIPLGRVRFPPSKPQAKRLLAPYEVDGWFARNKDIFNNHNRDHRYNTISVVFYRFVHAKGPPDGAGKVGA